GQTLVSTCCSRSRGGARRQSSCSPPHESWSRHYRAQRFETRFVISAAYPRVLHKVHPSIATLISIQIAAQNQAGSRKSRAMVAASDGPLTRNNTRMSYTEFRPPWTASRLRRKPSG